MSRFIQTAYVTAPVDSVERVIEMTQHVVDVADRKARAKGHASSGVEFRVVKKVPVGYRGLFNKRAIARYEFEIVGEQHQINVLKNYLRQFVL